MPTHSGTIVRRALYLSLLSLCMAAPAGAATVCTPTEREEFLDGSGAVLEPGAGDGHEDECEGLQQPPPDEGPKVVAHLPPGAQGARWFAVDIDLTQMSTGATAWVSQVVVSAPGAAPQVIEIGVRHGRHGTEMLIRGSDGHIVRATTDMPRVGGHFALMSIAVSRAGDQTMLSFGNPTGAAVRWPIATGASLTVLGTAKADAEPAVISLGIAR